MMQKDILNFTKYQNGKYFYTRDRNNLISDRLKNEISKSFMSTIFQYLDLNLKKKLAVKLL